MGVSRGGAFVVQFHLPPLRYSVAPIYASRSSNPTRATAPKRVSTRGLANSPKARSDLKQPRGGLESFRLGALLLVTPPRRRFMANFRMLQRDQPTLVQVTFVFSRDGGSRSLSKSVHFLSPRANPQLSKACQPCASAVHRAPSRMLPHAAHSVPCTAVPPRSASRLVLASPPPQGSRTSRGRQHFIHLLRTAHLWTSSLPATTSTHTRARVPETSQPLCTLTPH